MKKYLINDALNDLEAMGLGTIAAKIDRMLPKGDEPLSSQLLALSTVRDLVETVQMTLKASNTEMEDRFDMIRIDIIQALDAETYKVIRKAA